MTKTKIHDYKYIVNGEYGYAKFEINKDNVLILTFCDGQRFSKELKDELTLPKTRKTTIEKHVSEFYHNIKDKKYNGDVPQ